MDSVGNQPLKQSRRTRIGLVFSLGLLAMIVGLGLGWFFAERTSKAVMLSQGALLLPAQRVLPAFELQDHNGVKFGPQRLQGKWSLLFFGYTHCPDVCPATMAMLQEAARQLQVEANPGDIQFLFISVDPERDKLSQLKDYVTYFNPHFVGITGASEQLQILTSGLGILYQKVPNPDSPEYYTMDHSGVLLLVNPEGNWHALFSSPHDPMRLAQDFRAIQKVYSP